MKLTVVACLFIIAGAYGIQPTEVTSPQNRIIDYWLIDAIEYITQWLKINGLDPLETDREFEYVLIDGLVSVSGWVEGLKLKGISEINIDNLYFNILLGRLDVNLVIPEIWLEIGNSRIQTVYPNSKNDLEINGSLLLKNIRLEGDALLRYEWGAFVIYNINPYFSIENIQARFKVLESGQDISPKVNNFFNVTIPNLLWIYAIEISTILGEIIKNAVNSRW